MNKPLFILLSIMIVVLIGCAGNNKTNNKLIGILYVSGNEPFTHLSLHSNDDKYYKIECSDSLTIELWKLQGKTIELSLDELKEFDKLNIAVVNGYSVKDSE